MAALEAAFADDRVDAVLWLNGGDSNAELLRRLDFTLVADSPKLFVAPSEATVLHASLQSRARLVTLLGPPLGRNGAPDAFTRASLLEALRGDTQLGPVDPNGTRAVTLVSGVAEGELVGGSLGQLCSLLGTPWEPDLRGKIVLLMPPPDAPWRIRPHLTHLLNTGKLQEAAGIGFAGLGSSPVVGETLAELIAPLGIPAVTGLPLGHGPRLATVPLGVRARLDAYDGLLEILEPGVSA